MREDRIKEIAAILLEGILHHNLRVNEEAGFEVLLGTEEVPLGEFAVSNLDKHRLGRFIAMSSYFGLADVAQGQRLGGDILHNMVVYGRSREAKGLLFAAEDLGGYAWPTMGFLPTKKYLHNVRADVSGRSKILSERELITEPEKSIIEAFVTSEDPESLRMLLGLNRRIDIKEANIQFSALAVAKRNVLSLGQILLVGLNYQAKPDFNDRTSMHMFEQRTGHYAPNRQAEVSERWLQATRHVAEIQRGQNERNV